jgi:hypothetical protein
LWIVRINASCRAAGISYSQFIRGLKAAGLDLNRKVLADIALHDEAGFTSLIQAAKAALEEKPTAEPTVAPEAAAAHEPEAVAEPVTAAEPETAPETTAAPEVAAAHEPETAAEPETTPEPTV